MFLLSVSLDSGVTVSAIVCFSQFLDPSCDKQPCMTIENDSQASPNNIIENRCCRLLLCDLHSVTGHESNESNEGHEEGYEEAQGDEGSGGGTHESHESDESHEGHEKGHEGDESYEGNEGHEEVSASVHCDGYWGPCMV